MVVFATAAQAAGRIFYDGFEGGDTSKWRQDDFRNRCQVVTSSSDGVVGAFAGSRMARCNWNGTVDSMDPTRFESLKTPSISDTNELFYRVRLRVDKNFAKDSGSGGKILRVFNTSPSYNDIFATVRPGDSLNNEGVTGGTQMSTYWGSAAGDNTGSTSGWHEVEYYFNKSSGIVKVWHDGVLVRNESGRNFNGTWWQPLYLASNFSADHDSMNHVYFDEFEIFTEQGSGASGSMSNGTISASAEVAPNPPTDVRSQ
jgi:hypothetical protein